MRTHPGGLARLARLAVAALALVSLFHALTGLECLRDGVQIRTTTLGDTPLTVFSPDPLMAPAAGAGHRASPVVVIAHGFAGSQQLMQPFALTLAHNGYTAITFDFPGHGRNPLPMRGGLTDTGASLRTLLASLDEVGAHASQLASQLDPASGGRYAVIGHSMASDIAVRHAQAHPAGRQAGTPGGVLATVAVSLFAPSITATTPPDSPRNLLVIDGAIEPAVMAAEALRVVEQARPAEARTAQPAVAGRLYGDFAAGTARRAELAPAAEHIGVLYSAHTQAQSLAWLDRAFDRPAATVPFIDARGGLLGWLLLGVVALAWPLSSLLPRLQSTSRGAWVARQPWRRAWPVAWVPALLTPLVLWKLPTDVLPILLGDYLALHFALYGVLTAVVGFWLRRRAASEPNQALPSTSSTFQRPVPWPRPRLLLALLAVTAYALLAIGVPVDRYVFNVTPVAVRATLIAALCAGTLPWFLADEAFSRAADAPRGAYLVTKLAFALSLVLAIALNPGRLFFLAIIVPAILLLFIVYGLFSRWSHRACGDARVAAIANALAFGGFIAVTFPLVR